MIRRANYEVIVDNKDRLVLKDIGPWDQYLTITNASETVVEELIERLNGRRLFYYDSYGNLDEILIKDGKFYGWAPV